MIKENIEAVRRRIESAARRAGREPSDITLVCVTKEAAAPAVLEALAAGITDVGENRVQDAKAKQAALNPGRALKWHMIGHLQGNKAKDAVGMFDLIHSVDSIALLQEIDKRAARIGKRQDILLQLNISGERSKFGLDPSQTGDFIEAVRPLKNVRLSGLMAIAPLSDGPKNAWPCFRGLKKLFDGLLRARGGNIEMKYLSMGMSADFEAAIEEGANMVRIGSAIFK